MNRSLEAVLADARADADVLLRRGHTAEASGLRKLCADVEDSSREWLTFLPELEAALFTGESPRTLQRRFADLAQRGHAFRQGRTRCYRQCVLRRRSDARDGFDAGARAAAETAA